MKSMTISIKKETKKIIINEAIFKLLVNVKQAHQDAGIANLAQSTTIAVSWLHNIPKRHSATSILVS